MCGTCTVATAGLRKYLVSWMFENAMKVRKSSTILRNNALAYAFHLDIIMFLKTFFTLEIMTIYIYYHLLLPSSLPIKRQE